MGNEESWDALDRVAEGGQVGRGSKDGVTLWPGNASKRGVDNVFVKNLDRNIDNKALSVTFCIFGNVLSCKVATDIGGMSRGCGFVHCETEGAARRAIECVSGKQFGENEFADAAMTCNPGSHLWNQQVVDTSRCRDEGGDIDCLASQFEGKGGKAYVGKRQATIEQRRRYHTFSGAQRQYVEDAGMSIGVSCATLGDLPGDDTDTRWTFDQIEILV